MTDVFVLLHNYFSVISTTLIGGKLTDNVLPLFLYSENFAGFTLPGCSKVFISLNFCEVKISPSLFLNGVFGKAALTVIFFFASIFTSVIWIASALSFDADTFIAAML